MDARFLLDCFEPGEVDRIYLNFSDPWPKNRHSDRRLTSHNFLDIYRRLLSPHGEIHFKTDNVGLFTFSQEEIPSYGYELCDVTHDLYQSPYLEGNIATEYEEKFRALGHPIHRLVAKPILKGSIE